MRTKIINNKKYIIKTSPLKNKKYRVTNTTGQVIADYGAKGMRMYPGTKRGDSYCARSSGIKGTNDINSANYWARLDWNCKDKKSLKRKLL